MGSPPSQPLLKFASDPRISLGVLSSSRHLPLIVSAICPTASCLPSTSGSLDNNTIGELIWRSRDARWVQVSLCDDVLLSEHGPLTCSLPGVPHILFGIPFTLSEETLTAAWLRDREYDQSNLGDKNEDSPILAFCPS